jgi:hypothetical protein
MRKPGAERTNATCRHERDFSGEIHKDYGGIARIVAWVEVARASGLSAGTIKLLSANLPHP